MRPGQRGAKPEDVNGPVVERRPAGSAMNPKGFIPGGTDRRLRETNAGWSDTAAGATPVNRVGTGREASATRRARGPERNARSETARRNHRKQGDATPRTVAYGACRRTISDRGADGQTGRTGEPEAGTGAFGRRQRRSRNQQHLGEAGSGTNREPAAEPTHQPSLRRGTGRANPMGVSG